MTSLDRSVATTGLPTGKWSWLSVMTSSGVSNFPSVPGYLKFHANCSPVICTWRASWGILSLIFVQSPRDINASITQINAGMIVQITSSRLFPWV